MRFNHPPLRVRQIALVTLCLAVMLLSSGRRPHGESRLVSATSLESHRPRPLNTFRNRLLATKKLERLGPRDLFRRLEPLRFFWRSFDRTIRDDQRERIVTATEE